MKHKKRFSKRNLLISFILVAAVVTTSIFAYLTTSKEAINVFNVGEVSVDIKEPNWKPDTDSDNDGTKDTVSNIVPNASFEKDPTIYNTGENDAYVYMLVEIPKVYNTNISTKDENGNWKTEEVNHYPLFNYEANEGWTLIDKQTGTEDGAYDYFLYAYDTALAPKGAADGADVSTPLFDEVTFANITSDFANVLTGNDIINLKINLTGYAIQSDFYGDEADDAVEAWELYANQNNWTWPVKGYEGLATLTYRNENKDVIYSEIVYNGTPIELYFDDSLAKTGYTFDWVIEDTGETATDGMTADGDTFFDPSYNDDPIPPNIYSYDILTYEVRKNSDGSFYLASTGLDTSNPNYTGQTLGLVIPPTVTFEVPQTATRAVSTFAASDEITIYAEGGTVTLDTSLGLSPGEKTLTVKSVASEAFADVTKINSVVVASTVTAIGGQAFKNCINVKSVHTPFILELVSEEAFSGCTKLTSIELPERITYLGDSLFYNCTALTSAKLPTSLEFCDYNIGDYTFYNCYNLTSVNIPANEATVGSIGDYAFYGCKKITNLEIPEDVGVIGDYAFSGCSAISNTIILPENLNYLGEYAFQGCSKIPNVDFNKNIDQIGAGAFKNCTSLTDAILQYGPTEIATSTFEGCTSLDVAVIPSSVNHISDRAFYGCTSLASVTGGGRLGSIGGYAFYNCTKLLNISALRSIASIGQSAFYNCKVVQELIFMKNLSSIPASAFAYCTSLKSIEISDNITSIGTNAFYGCTGIEKLSTPATINMQPFNSCTNIKELTITKGTEPQQGFVKSPWDFCKGSLEKIIVADTVERLGSNTFLNLSAVTEISLPVSVEMDSEALAGCTGIKKATITQGNGTSIDYAANVHLYSPLYYIRTSLEEVLVEDGVQRIGDRYFYSCTSLKDITISDTVTHIGTLSFYNCTSLSSITMGKNVTEIGTQTFNRCSALTSVTFSENTEKIGTDAFNGCTALKEVYMSASIKDVLSGAFNCTVEKVYFDGTISEWCNINFESLASNPLYSAAELYINDKLVTELSLSEDTLNIKPYTFCGYTSLQDVVTGDGVTEIGEYAFYKCSNIKSLSIGDKLANIDQYAFSNCTSLTEITTGNGSTFIGNSAFYNCTGLKKVDLTDAISGIGTGAFQGCSNITELNISGSITEIPDRAFYSCNKLEELVIGENVEKIGNSAFGNCSLLVELTFGEKVKEMNGSFYNCNKLKTVNYTGNLKDWCDINFTAQDGLLGYNTDIYVNGQLLAGDILIPQEITELKDYTFCNRKSITGIEFPSGLTKIGDYTFYNNESLLNIDIPAGVADIGDFAFYGCSKITDIALCEGLVTIGSSAFAYNRALESFVIPDTVTSLGDSAFEVCTSLQSVVFGEGLSALPNNLFDTCSSLTEITIPKNIIFIGESAFDLCNGLVSVYYEGSVDDWCRLKLSNARSTPMCYAENLYINGQKPSGTITIPNDVTEINYYLFKNCTDINEVIIPDSVVNINDYAFSGCTSLAKINMPTSLTKIGSGAFYDCTSLESISIPYGIEKIYDTTFYNCSKLADVDLPDTINTVDSRAFYACSSLKNISLDKVTSYGDYAFANCSSLEKLVVEGITYSGFGEYAFRNCTALKEIVVPAYAKFTKSVYNGTGYSDVACFDGCVNIEKVTLTAGKMLDYTVGSCKLTPWYISRRAPRIILEDGVTHIGSYAFYGSGAAKVGALIIPDSVTTIGENAYYTGYVPFLVIPNTIADINISNVYNLEHIYYTGTEEEWASAYQQTLSANTTVYYNAEIITQDYATYAVVSAEEGREAHLIRYEGTEENVTIPDTINNVTVTQIMPFAFIYQHTIKEVSLPDSITLIGNYGFRGCDNLAKINVPNNISYIGGGAFMGCEKLEQTLYFGTIEQWNGVTLESGNDYLINAIVINAGSENPCYGTGECGTNATWTLYTDGELIIEGSGAMTNYTTTSYAPWDSKAHLVKTITITNDITSVGDYAFHKCVNTTKINIPDNLSIYGSAFEDCVNIEKINVTYNTGNIPNCTSSNYQSTPWNLIPNASVDIENGVTSIGDYTFYNCEKISSLPTSVVKVGNYSLAGCTGFTNWDFINNLNEIGEGAFYGCTPITQITLSENLSILPDKAFYGCVELTNATLNGVESIGSYAFYNCSKLSEACLSEGLLSIGSYAFNACTELTSVNISDSTTNIGEYAFYGCSKLSSVIIGNNVTTLGDYAFYNCVNIAELTMPASLYVDDHAFNGCTNIKKVILSKGTGKMNNSSASSSSVDGLPWIVSRNTIEEVILEEGIENIGNYTFYYCKNLKAITIPNTITSIGRSAFSNCTGLTEITIPNSVTTFGPYAFENCTSLTDVYYLGTEDDWSLITIGVNNDILSSATIHYNS